MKIQNIPSRNVVIKERPDYYITPTRDFKQYTRDAEEKYWNKETKFDWQQDVRGNLKDHLEKLNKEDFSKILFMVLPMVSETLARKISEIQRNQLPLEEDALKDIAECIPFESSTIQKALQIQSPLAELQLTVVRLKDQSEILNSEFLDIREQQRLGFFKVGTSVKHLRTDDEKQEQTLRLAGLTDQIGKVQAELKQKEKQYIINSNQLKIDVRKALSKIGPQIIADLDKTQELVARTLESMTLPAAQEELTLLKNLVLKRQLLGLKDIANHSLVVEQSAIAPLTMGIIHYKRYREIQEAMTTFISDEAKHSATFRRYLVEKLEAKEFISALLIKGAGRYMWIGRYMPGAGMFLAVIVEVIGAATLEFFGDEKYMPDKLFCKICQTISLQDEKRHMDLCVAMYNELFRTGSRWERFRNKNALKVILKSVYGDKTDDHRLIQAFRAFGVDSVLLYEHVTNRLSQQLSRISMYVEPQTLLKIMGRI